ncbi:hypothetical protein GNI_060490 [Gregarina niphandrodes]|uniref:Uncharacterized protein n=1 Tax=Gregarina niphandrodes TaxID=110365 RepID=A0A023B8D2_GRENI|nr:hypothetical protein GNI_060490 [Gregarina niphandrodes]EZG68993.1 hypothetical protein GNI_060490 [Gregarina niphandrodes]|eukprot:XP_011134511.1 hypothetical protein GNI_060490 [Gregarina niphandrodes]
MGKARTTKQKAKTTLKDTSSSKLSRGQRKRQEKHEKFARREQLALKIGQQKAQDRQVKLYGSALAELEGLDSVLKSIHTEVKAQTAEQRLKDLKLQLGKQTLSTKQLTETETAGTQLFFQRWTDDSVRKDVFGWVKQKLATLSVDYGKKIKEYSDIRSTLSKR